MKTFVLLCVFASAFADFSRDCGENEHFESCGTACPLTCDNYDNPPKFCVLRCDIGCFCDEGYVRSADGRCVRPEQCPARVNKVCGENERYYECGTACPLTCENFENPPKICPLMCVIGCQCEKGFLQTKDGRCVRPEDCPAEAPNQEKSCLGKPDPGMCRGYFPSYYYDVQTGKCEKFIYGGCQGNGNRYATEEECLDHCSGVSPRQFSSDVCDQPAETGLCRGFFPRFYFDKATGKCEKFVYGGCGGNENNFNTVEECEQTCAPRTPTACLEDKVVGNCKASLTRYYYNKETGKCEEFIYGGCGGNSNNFIFEEDCEEVCNGSS